MTTELPFRIEAANGNHYVVEDNGDRSLALTECPNRIASPVELQLWTALENATEKEPEDKGAHATQHKPVKHATAKHK